LGSRHEDSERKEISGEGDNGIRDEKIKTPISPMEYSSEPAETQSDTRAAGSGSHEGEEQVSESFVDALYLM
jgi:hypothetical protein